jgi:cyclohexyl-isocyanide hydratase
MNRRDFLTALTLSTVMAETLAAPTVSQAQGGGAPPKLRVGMLVYSDMILLDLAGPLTVFNLSQAETFMVSQDLEPVRTDVGIPVKPNATFETCPADLDVLFVPGGLRGTIACMKDRATLTFLAKRAESARFVTSVCTGSLVLGAAGLLRGYKATSHWYTREHLAILGAEPVAARVVEDRNRITAGGVTAGIDFGLALAARLRGEELAKRVQLVLEYDPKPPFAAGSPEGSGPELAAQVLKARAPALAEAKQAAEAAAQFKL